MPKFIEYKPELLDYWRYIVLFGRNVASYKFALANSLLELSNTPDDLITLEQLAEPFSRYITEHLSKVDKQGTSSSSVFLNSCRKYNNEKLSQDKLLKTTTELGFNNVIDAFHIVHGSETEERFFIDERKINKGIRITENLYRLNQNTQFDNLFSEVESRWNLVETAWSLNISKNLISVFHDIDNNTLFTFDNNKRINVTSSISSLNGYQKGFCFYCFEDLHIEDNSEKYNVDVDHFLPHVLQRENILSNLDGVWNLVLSCQSCNRGINGKFEKIPEKELLNRLHTRNEFYIESHHPLRETLILQTGKTEKKRSRFLQQQYLTAQKHILSTWKPETVSEPKF